MSEIVLRDEMKQIVRIREKEVLNNIDKHHLYSRREISDIKCAIEEQMELDSLYITSDGNFYFGTGMYDDGVFLYYLIFLPNDKIEQCSKEDREERLIELSREICAYG